MVDLKASNIKLVDRSIRIIMNTTGVDASTAEETLEQASMNCKLAIMMIKTGLDAKEAEQALNANGGRLKQAISSLA
ncbi:N-acetylmuramic acid 6-phosphate etherase [compost metagenome]